jgi:hypothetical protein
LGCKSPRNAQTAALSAAVCFHKQLSCNHLPRMTRAGFEPATYGLKERPEFIPRVLGTTSKFVLVPNLMVGDVRSRFSEFLWGTRRFRDKWGATRVQLFETRFAGFEPRTSRVSGDSETPTKSDVIAVFTLSERVICRTSVCKCRRLPGSIHPEFTPTDSETNRLPQPASRPTQDEPPPTRARAAYYVLTLDRGASSCRSH